MKNVQEVTSLKISINICRMDLINHIYFVLCLLNMILQEDVKSVCNCQQVLIVIPNME